MGPSYSLAVSAANSIVKSAISVAIKYTQECSARLKNNQSVNLTNCDFRGARIDLNNIGVGVVRCAQDVNNRANIEQAVQQAIRQSTEAASQQLGLRLLSVNAAFSVTNVEQSITQAIVESFTQTCTNNFANTQSFNCNNSTVYLSDGLYLNNYQSSLVDCTFNAVSSTDAYQQLVQAIEQSTVAKEESIFSAYVVLGLVAVAVISIIAMVFARKRSEAAGTGYATTTRVSNTSAWIIVGIVALVCIGLVVYSLLANSNGWWPFQTSTAPRATGFQLQ